MPTRPSLVREVYAELQRELGNIHGSRELLEVASKLVEASQAGYVPRFTLHVGGIPFEERPLYRVFVDGGYKVWLREAANDEDGLHPREFVYRMNEVLARAA